MLKRAITDDTVVGYDVDGREIKAERLSKWAYSQLETAPALYDALQMAREVMEISEVSHAMIPQCGMEPHQVAVKALNT